MNLPFCRSGFGTRVAAHWLILNRPTVRLWIDPHNAETSPVAPRCYHRAEMKMFGHAALFAWCLGVAACGSSEPRSPLILGGNPPDARGPQDLTASQMGALKKLITTAGETCGAIVGKAFLSDTGYRRDTDPAVGWESWEVQCTEAPYAVMVSADGTPAAVRRCVGGGFGDSPCAQPTERSYRSYGGRRPPEGPLNPDLGKLLEPMTAKDGKSD